MKNEELSQGPQEKGLRRPDEGFSLVEVMLAVFVTSVGLVSLLALFAQAIATTQLAQQEMIARQKAREALESIFTARNTQQITFDLINNTGNGGVFLAGWQPLRRPNPPSGAGDGLVGTADDGDVDKMELPGPDGYMGTPDDQIIVLDNYERQITISPIAAGGGGSNPDLRQITIQVRYTTPGGMVRTFDVSSYVSRYR